MLCLWIAALGFGRSADPAPVVYQAVPIRTKEDVTRLRSRLGERGLLAVQKVNRRDLRHFKPGIVLQVPAGDYPLEDLSPFPAEIREFAEVPKLILVSQAIQAFGAYAKGLQVHWGPVSTGTEKQVTPVGLYHTNWRSPKKVSTINRRWLMRWYFNLHASMGLAFHEYAMPGYPASYGCIRLMAEDAKWIYRWADEGVGARLSVVPEEYGTPVVVFGEFDYSQPPPWDRLRQDPLAAHVDVRELEAVIEKYLKVILERRRPGEGPGRREESDQAIQSAALQATNRLLLAGSLRCP